MVDRRVEVRARGFTLIEMMIVVSCAAVVAGAAGALYLEVRLAGATAEAKLRLQRDAVLVAEWTARDLRDADRVETSSAAVAIARRDGVAIQYRVQATGGLSRDDGAARLLSRWVSALSVETEPDGRRVVVVFERPLAVGRTVHLQRSHFVRVRR